MLLFLVAHLSRTHTENKQKINFHTAFTLYRKTDRKLNIISIPINWKLNVLFSLITAVGLLMFPGHQHNNQQQKQQQQQQQQQHTKLKGLSILGSS